MSVRFESAVDVVQATRAYHWAWAALHSAAALFAVIVALGSIASAAYHFRRANW